MKKHTSHIAGLLALLLILSSFAACTSGNTDTPPENESLSESMDTTIESTLAITEESDTEPFESALITTESELENTKETDTDTAESLTSTTEATVEFTEESIPETSEAFTNTIESTIEHMYPILYIL